MNKLLLSKVFIVLTILTNINDPNFPTELIIRKMFNNIKHFKSLNNMKIWTLNIQRRPIKLKKKK